jgi:hypothetical protein
MAMIVPGMKHFICILLIIWPTGCSLDEIPIAIPQLSARSSRTIQYTHLVVGDSLGYDWTGLDTAVGAFFAHIDGKAVIGHKTYYNMVDYPIGSTATFLVREDGNGDLYALGLFDTVTIENAVEKLLYKTSAQTGSSWKFYYFGDPIQCIMLSRSDTVKTYAGVFLNCLRIRIQYYGWAEYEDQWLAPGVGLVRRDIESIFGHSLFMPQLDLKVLRLKSNSRR